VVNGDAEQDEAGPRSLNMPDGGLNIRLQDTPQPAKMKGADD